MSTDALPRATVTEAAHRPAGSVLLDVREDDEWAEAHAPDAVHVPMGRLTLDTVPPGRPVYCICRSGNRSGRVVAALVAAGIDARNVAGGMQAWAAAGLPVVT
ncbi:rhodanese-like domain-containing protein [Iamia sp. SCSIO 61187]|uniref:rhodanese-like domain-containing protein n=1 Tax=Iamia sp. SCSIO 61187 TaxID=2722752 RepID=UPI001C62B595|nr:rhodanese-like domain-containing protein [Iamia sp. SCSIO 61187]QYG93178.1 rhodanese-like domain-containing protein [Iamia sp. SCSIO 61187]